MIYMISIYKYLYSNLLKGYVIFAFVFQLNRPLDLFWYFDCSKVYWTIRIYNKCKNSIKWIKGICIGHCVTQKKESYAGLEQNEGE